MNSDNYLLIVMTYCRQAADDALIAFHTSAGDRSDQTIIGHMRVAARAVGYDLTPITRQQDIHGYEASLKTRGTGEVMD